MEPNTSPNPPPGSQPFAASPGGDTGASGAPDPREPRGIRDWPSGLYDRTLRPSFRMVLCLAFGLFAGVLLDRWYLLFSLPSDAVSGFRLMSEVWNTIDRYYVDRAAVQPKALTYGAASGMVDALGDTDHSVFLSPEMVEQLRRLEHGRFKGVGLEVRMKDEHVVIVAPIDNSPAQRAGLRSGEIIISVNGRNVAGLPLNQVVQLITGPAGTPVTLGILEPKTGQHHTVTLVRAEVKLVNVAWQRLPDTEVADLRIADFSGDVAGNLRRALREIQAQQLRGMILDLRDNPGGVLDKAVAVASQFLSGGNVLLVKDARGKITPVPVQAGGLFTNAPMAVLINGGSASGAEILAGALRDAHRAVLVGETTFGTGTVLREFPLTGGAALMLAVQEWLTPDGHSIWHKGIAPELEVPLPAGAIPLILIGDKKITAADLRSSDDPQLLRALKWVEARIKEESAGGSEPDAAPAARPVSAGFTGPTGHAEMRGIYGNTQGFLPKQTETSTNQTL